MSLSTESDAEQTSFQKNRLFVTNFGTDRTFQEIRRMCMEGGGEHIVCMTLSKTVSRQSAFPTYTDDETAAKALERLRLNNFRCNYAKIKADRRAQMESKGIKVSTMPLPKPEFKYRTEFEDGNKVRIIAMYGHRVFVVAQQDRDKHKKFMKNINDSGNRMEQWDGPSPEPTTMVVLPYKGQFRRAVIVSEVPEEKNLMELFLVDIFERIHLRVNELKKLPPNFRSDEGFGPHVRFVHTFLMNGLELMPKNNDYVANCLKEFRGTDWMIKAVKANKLEPRDIVDLVNSNGRIKCLNTLIKQLLFKPFTVDSLIEKRPTHYGNGCCNADQASCDKDKKPKTICIVDDTKLRNERMNTITAVERKDFDLFVCIQDTIQKCGAKFEQLPAYVPDIFEEIVIVKIGELWYRAIYFSDNEKDEDEVWLQLVDNMTVVSVKKANIRKIISVCAKLDVLTFVAKFQGHVDQINDDEFDNISNKFRAEATVQIAGLIGSSDVYYTIEI